MGTVRRTIVAGCVLVALLGACGGPNYRYIANSQENLFFKVPKAWKVYQLTSSDKEGRPVPVSSSFERSWHLLIDANPQPDPKHLGDHAPELPMVEAQVYVLERSANDTESLSDLRRLVYKLPRDADPLLNDPAASRAWEVVVGSLRDLRFPKGLTGTRLAINIPDPTAKDDPSKFATLDAIAMHDVLNSRVYMLSVRCSSQCYLDHRSEIDDLMNSWTVNRT
jgi:hypothetical protein